MICHFQSIHVYSTILWLLCKVIMLFMCIYACWKQFILADFGIIYMLIWIIYVQFAFGTISVNSDASFCYFTTLVMHFFIDSWLQSGSHLCFFLPLVDIASCFILTGFWLTQFCCIQLSYINWPIVSFLVCLFQLFLSWINFELCHVQLIPELELEHWNFVSCSQKIFDRLKRKERKSMVQIFP